MTFGDDIFYNRLKQEFYSENNYVIHKELLDLIGMKARQLFPSHRHLISDIQQEAAIRIMGKAMLDFLDNDVFAFSPKRVALRNGWFRTLVRNAGIDLLRGEFRNTRVPISSGAEDGDNPVHVYIQPLDQPIDSNDGGSATLKDFLADPQNGDPLEALISREKVNDAFQQLFSLPKTKPDKIIVCAFVVLAGHLGLSNGAKELNSNVADRLQGLTYSGAADVIERMLRMAQVSPSVIEPLRKRLAAPDESGSPIGGQIFDIDTRTVTHQSSSTRKQLRDNSDDDAPRDNVVPFPSQRKDGK